MIKASAIIAQLQAVLPKKTSLFSNPNIEITSLIRSGTTITGITAIPHGLVVNNYINIMGALTPIDIISVTSAPNYGLPDTGSIVTVVTEQDHDFTEGFDITTTITGADQTEYNGTFSILTVPNRRTFTYALNAQPDSPATGPILLLNNLNTGYNGRVQITTVSDSTTFTYETDLTPNSPAEGSAFLRNGIRVSGAISWERALAAYTKQAPNNLWAFVVLGDNSVSKDRNVTTDAISTLAPGDMYRQRIISQFSIFVYAPCTDEISGRKVRDLMEDVRIAIYKSLLRVQFASGLSETKLYVVTASGDRSTSFTDGAYYIHEFMFEVVCDIVHTDTVDPEDSVAFRNFNLIMNDTIDDGDNSLMELDDVNLDDVPL